MASLMEELITTLEAEDALYAQLLPITESKTRAIIKNNLEELQTITGKEQEILDRVNVLERKREEIINNIGIVMNKDPKILNIRSVIQMLNKQPAEQDRLSAVHDSLHKNVNRLVDNNRHNKSLIEDSLEMIEFNLNFIQSTRMSPGTHNYTKGAAADDRTNMPGTGTFDAKQ